MERPETAIGCPTRSSETPAATPGIGRESGIPSSSPLYRRNSPFPNRTRTSFGNRRIAWRAFGWKTMERTIQCIKYGTFRRVKTLARAESHCPMARVCAHAVETIGDHDQAVAWLRHSGGRCVVWFRSGNWIRTPGRGWWKTFRAGSRTAFMLHAVLAELGENWRRRYAPEAGRGEGARPDPGHAESGRG
jgi:hypothetical protein